MITFQGEIKDMYVGEYSVYTRVADLYYVKEWADAYERKCRYKDFLLKF